jgi:rod shape-determining protein MreC
VPDPDHQPYTLIRLRPAVNLDQLAEVLVITGTETELPVAAKQDLALGAATAEAQAAAKDLADQQAAEAAAKSAAQIVAERLPSLPEADRSDGKASAAPSVDTVTPSTAVPKPVPTIHPDRYTPGATLPATALKPGAAEPNPAGAVATPSTDTTPLTQPAVTPKPHKPKPAIQTAPPSDTQPQ